MFLANRTSYYDDVVLQIGISTYRATASIDVLLIRSIAWRSDLHFATVQRRIKSVASDKGTLWIQLQTITFPNSYSDVVKELGTTLNSSSLEHAQVAAPTPLIDDSGLDDPIYRRLSASLKTFQGHTTWYSRIVHGIHTRSVCTWGPWFHCRTTERHGIPNA